ncbi:Mannosyl-oligosaccharide 1,2-alpha-mannosidase [Purpureocillium takamizusanense]|uniref:alpha-1,2-Mannosidase n=1 Tax=Purpureocillium takamizusanense TaxID=2060973 RepID=A0A9Q8V7E9_9HYPO|nr:Mannosyl-oligosaccharide 1,2-alpha-mannosidase [Purpureocillium takamizusanense]UNI15935.1 Mannosyl-oligosaccharide 1,2-alpha-mannosidase [Purpureocillium takamizusanense]
MRSWKAYKEHAWLRDEVTPITGKPVDTFGGWGATLVDSLDTLYIMGLREEFSLAVEAVSNNISFETTEAKTINVFETTIRFLGGLLGAYDLSGDTRLLSKAQDVGDMLYKAFDTPNHLPVTRWDIHAAARGEPQTAHGNTLLAELGSLTMEFSRLSILTGNPKYYDAVQHISELLAAAQAKTKVPGLWPIVVDASHEEFDLGSDYGLSGMADSAYEYLPKMAALFGQSTGIYADMYLRSMEASNKHLFFRPMTPKADDILFPGSLHASLSDNHVSTNLDPSAGHLTCFVGGMLALGGRVMSNKTHVEWADKFTKGCIWAYSSFERGVMPETMSLTPCSSRYDCQWSNSSWHGAILSTQSISTGAEGAVKVVEEQRLPPSFTKIPDARYILRPEAVESVFVMYRVTGDPSWQDEAWRMWTAIDKMTHTELANTAVWNVNPKPGEDAGKADSMESFWLGETLKYLYLIFSEPELVSLDDWVFNTEAHPFRRLKK